MFVQSNKTSAKLQELWNSYKSEELHDKLISLIESLNLLFSNVRALQKGFKLWIIKIRKMSDSIMLDINL